MQSPRRLNQHPAMQTQQVNTQNLSHLYFLTPQQHQLLQHQLLSQQQQIEQLKIANLDLKSQLQQSKRRQSTSRTPS